MKEPVIANGPASSTTSRVGAGMATRCGVVCCGVAAGGVSPIVARSMGANPSRAAVVLFHGREAANSKPAHPHELCESTTLTHVRPCDTTIKPPMISAHTRVHAAHTLPTPGGGWLHACGHGPRGEGHLDLHSTARVPYTSAARGWPLPPGARPTDRTDRLQWGGSIDSSDPDFLPAPPAAALAPAAAPTER